jgi:CheY-like chemotaxis protein
MGMMDMDDGQAGNQSQILVVDDDPQVLKYCETVLTELGYSVTSTTSGSAATRLLKERRFDLLILDLSMPDTDGFEILQMVRTQMRELKVLVISGFMQGTLLKAAELVGANATLDKPSTPERLAQAVGKLLAKSA